MRGVTASTSSWKNCPSNAAGAGDYPLAWVLESEIGSVPDVVEHIEHHASGEGGQQYVIADTHPVITVRRGVEPVRSPVVHDVRAAVVGARQVIAAVPGTVVIAIRRAVGTLVIAIARVVLAIMAAVIPVVGVVVPVAARAVPAAMTIPVAVVVIAAVTVAIAVVIIVVVAMIVAIPVVAIVVMPIVAMAAIIAIAAVIAMVVATIMPTTVARRRRTAVVAAAMIIAMAAAAAVVVATIISMIVAVSGVFVRIVRDHARRNLPAHTVVRKSGGAHEKRSSKNKGHWAFHL